MKTGNRLHNSLILKVI